MGGTASPRLGAGLLAATLGLAPAFAQEGAVQDPPTGTTRAVPGVEDVPVAIQSGLEFLAGHQNEDGSWGGFRNATFTSGFANPATYDTWQIGTTALGARALLELDSTSRYTEELEQALDFLIANTKPVRPAEWDVDNNWSLVYGLDAVAKALQHPRYAEGPRRAQLVQAGQELLVGLKKYQSPRGGWGYYSDPNAGWQPEWATSFTTAVAVLAMIEAREAGLELDEKVYRAGVNALKYARLPNGAYNYDVAAVPRHMRMESINQVKGSLGRIQACNLALFRAGEEDVTVEDLVWGLEQFVKHHKFLEVARNKPIPHEAYYANAAYFYLFAHYYAAQVLQQLPEKERAKFAPHVQEGILRTRQKDGAMWDFWIAANTKPYGTAFGAMALEYSLPVKE